MSGQVDGILDKLKNSGAFERDGETNVFTRISKSIVDTLANHWTTTRGPGITLSFVSTQLVEKHQKHQKFLQFLALSKCHEELCSRQSMNNFSIKMFCGSPERNAFYKFGCVNKCISRILRLHALCNL